jgi:large subunit ribosomal protein L30
MAGKKKAAGSGAGARRATGKITIQYYRSAIGFNQKQKLIVKGLGFGKLSTTRELTDTPSVRGMVAKVPHLVRILEG